MSSVLSEEQLLLINNLLYLGNNPPLQELQEGKTIGDVLNSIDLSQIDSSKDYSSFTSGEEWKQILNACKSDPQITGLTVTQSHIDPQYGGQSFLLTTPNNEEAIVAFQGTSMKEWHDNFTGGGPTNLPDGVSTDCQDRALNWYQSLDLDGYENVTVTGHSKGGNKSQYIAIMDDSVDRCVSFDGQGFSDEFYDKYGDKIAANQHKITNCSDESDYVNFLLNSVGTQKYYTTNANSVKSNTPFAENHCPNTMLSFDENGNPVMTETANNQANKNIRQLDEFLNSYLRATDNKAAALDLVGTLMQKFQNHESTQDILDYLTNGTHREEVSFLLAYLLAYRAQHPEIADALKEILTGLGAEDACDIIDVITDLQDKGWLDDLAVGVGDFAQFGPIQALLKNYIAKKTGLSFSDSQYQDVCNMLKDTGTKMNNITIKENTGKDRFVISPSQLETYLYVDSVKARSVADRLNHLAKRTRYIAKQVSNINFNDTRSLLLIAPALQTYSEKINRCSDNLETCANSLSSILEQYTSAEERITSYITIQ